MSATRRGSVDSQAPTAAAETARSGEREVLGARYELLGLLGTGGMGNVYKARDLELDEVVALKVLLPARVGAPGALERFRREVKLARRVTHPNVARVFDIGRHGDDRVLTMEYVDGESLAERMRRSGRLGVAAAVEIARAIGAGVGAAHDAGVVHRDLKPDNVLLSAEGRVVVTDFGIARAMADGKRTAGFLGTPAYMAPEQLDDRQTIDWRADIYAFGVVLYEMLAGDLPWRADSPWALAAARLLQPPPELRTTRPDVPDWLVELVTRCLAVDPASRPPAMHDVARALTRDVASDPERSAPEPEATFRPRPTTTGSYKTVAVLPFENLGPTEQDYVADGLTQDLIDLLSVARGLRVRSRGARREDARRDPRDIGRELGVHVVVEGSVGPTAGGSFRVRARLVSVADGFQLWARRFDVSEGELLAENDAIARAIADALTVDLAVVERAPAGADAVDLYLRARHAHRHAFSGDSRLATRLFDELCALTPDDPRALAGRAMAGAMQVFSDVRSRRLTREAADRAAELAPMLPEAHAARSWLAVAEGDLVGAIEPARRALLLAPGQIDAHAALGHVLQQVGRQECRKHLDTVLVLDPTEENPYIDLVWHHELCGERERVSELLELARARQVDVGFRLETRLALWRRDRARAAELWSRLEPHSPQSLADTAWYRSCLALVATGEGPASRPPHPPPGMVMPHLARCFFLEMEVEVACFRGDLEAALDALRALDAERCANVAWLSRVPLLEPLLALPEATAIRTAFERRAERVVAAYLGSQGRAERAEAVTVFRDEARSGDRSK